ncbi:MAG: helix-turn-helix transcriptional regulator [Chloroflexota bacterium]|nr:helix-turn-helix transcriptional regulator [Chloroflexota bacterium]
MDTVRVGLSLRSVRIRRGWRQEDVAAAAGLHRSTVSVVERGHWDALSFGTIARIATVLGVRLDITARWRGGDLDRLLNAGHSALHEILAQLFDDLPEWVRQPEVSFAIYGERGVIDILAFHPASGSLLVIELKTEIVDVQDLVGGVDRKTRLAAQVARSRGWMARSTACWVVVRDTRTNRRRMTAHGSMLRSAFPADGHAVRSWLVRPRGSMRALSFMTVAHDSNISQRTSGVKRVRKAA